MNKRKKQAYVLGSSFVIFLLFEVPHLPSSVGLRSLSMESLEFLFSIFERGHAAEGANLVDTKSTKENTCVERQLTPRGGAGLSPKLNFGNFWAESFPQK